MYEHWYFESYTGPQGRAWQSFASVSSKSLFVGQTALQGAKVLRKTKAPPKCKFFGWTVLHNRCWTAHLRYRHNLQDHDRCNLCDQGSETLDHLLVQCSFNRDVWHRLLNPLGLQSLVPSANEFSFVDWWVTSRKRLPKDHNKAFDSFVLLVAWMIWKE